jgi:hypothetical protein
MKAITICQPYAHLIVQGRKTCENRNWATSHRGRIYIHAGKNRSWLDLENGVDLESGVAEKLMPFGAIVAIADLVACINTESSLLREWVGKMTDEQRHHVNGPWCWILANVTPIGPWPWRGAQGLFDIDEEELGRVANRVLGIPTPRGATTESGDL